MKIGDRAARRILSMIEFIEEARKLSNEELIDNVISLVWSELPLGGMPSAVLDELIDRFAELVGIDLDERHIRSA